MSIYSVDNITKQAIAATKTSSNVNDCCPYPFDTDAGRLFRTIFEAACKHKNNAVSLKAAIGTALTLDQVEAIA